MTNYTRAIPVDEVFTKTKGVEALYWYMLSIAKYEHNSKTTYIPKEDLNVSYITGKREEGGLKICSRSQFYKLIDKMIDKEIIVLESYKGKESYLINAPSKFALVDIETIEYLLKNVQDHVLKTYAYLRFLLYVNDGTFAISPTTLVKNAWGITNIRKGSIVAAYETMDFLSDLRLISFETKENDQMKDGMKNKDKAKFFEVHDVLQKSDLAQG